VSLTYADVGATALDPVPARLRPFHRRERVGPAAAFDRVATALVAFDVHRVSGLRVSSSAPVAAPGVTALVQVSFGPVRISAPTEVVYVVDEPDRRGFAYGTLPGHPESGEERFVVVRSGGSAYLEITAFSTPGRWFTRLAGPVGRLLQRRATAAYLSAAREIAAS
jgi:uncharacterized protein (UPF0548 family)